MGLNILRNQIKKNVATNWQKSCRLINFRMKNKKKKKTWNHFNFLTFLLSEIHLAQFGAISTDHKSHSP